MAPPPRSARPAESFPAKAKTQRRFVDGGLLSARRRQPTRGSTRSARHPQCGNSNATPPFSESRVWSSAPLPLVLARAGRPRSRERRGNATWMFLTETGRSPGTRTAGTQWMTRRVNRTLAESAFSGSAGGGCPKIGSEGPAVQADSTWYSEGACRSAHRDRGGLDRSVVPAAIACQADLRPRAQSAAPPLRRLPDLRNRTHA
jgi:hypothetical protein